MARLTELSKSLIRRVGGSMVVRITAEGVAIKAYRARRWKHVSWAQIAALSDDSEPINKLSEERIGNTKLLELRCTKVKDCHAEETQT